MVMSMLACLSRERNVDRGCLKGSLKPGIRCLNMQVGGKMIFFMVTENTKTKSAISRISGISIKV